MSSILTNNSAMVALQTLKSINANLAGTQNEISTGKSVSNAKDNSAVWAISKVMSSDVQGFKAISDSLSLGESTVAVAQNGAESVTDLLTQIKGKIVNAQEDNVDRAKIQSDIVALRDQISSVVGAAQFNGLNLLGGGDDMDILSSLDRSADRTVSIANITVASADLRTDQTVIAGDATYVAGSATAGAAAAVLNATQTQALNIAGVTAGVAFSIGLTGTDANSSTFAPADYTTSADVAGASQIVYIAQEGDDAAAAPPAVDTSTPPRASRPPPASNPLVADVIVSTRTEMVSVPSVAPDVALRPVAVAVKFSTLVSRLFVAAYRSQARFRPAPTAAASSPSCAI
jgi:flagellin